MIRKFFRRPPPPPAAPAPALHARAELLVHAAMQDSDNAFLPRERAVILDYLTQTCHFAPDVAQAMLAQAEIAEAERTDLFNWTREINRHCSGEEKLHLLEALWRVVLADGIKDMYESTLLRRLAGLLHISDHEAAAARARAAAFSPKE